MSEEKKIQSFSLSSEQISGQIGSQASRALRVSQIQRMGPCNSEATLTQADLIELIGQLERVFRHSGLPEVHSIKVIRQLEAVKAEAQAEEPDKAFAANSLQRAAKLLKDASATVGAGTSLWEKVQPIITRLSPWLGVGESFFA